MILVPTARAASRPYYITETRMDAVAIEHHNWGRGYLDVLDANCLGQGYSRGQFPYQRYHLFLCFLTAKGWMGEYHVSVTRRGNRAVYTPTLITSFQEP